MKHFLRRIAITIALASMIDASYSITITIQPIDRGQGGVGGSGLSASQLATLESSASYWGQLLPSYQSGITLGGISIRAHASPFDGVGNTFAEAGPDTGNLSFQRGLFLATSGEIQFDSADIDSLETTGTLPSVMSHEIAHVLGFGTLWGINGLATDGSGQYFGGRGVAAYASEFSPGAFSVPVELGGSAGTRNVHWNEVDFGTGPTGIADAAGRDFGNELMTGWTGPDMSDTFLSQTTLAAFEDLGFETAPIPEPSVSFLIFCSTVLATIRRRR